AQEFIDTGIVTDVEKLETIAGLALAKAEKGPPADDPFATTEEPAPADPSGGFQFETIASLDDDNLAAAMRMLLKSIAARGASDLHLSTGARPFIRQHRQLSYVSNYVLTADDALRANTALLSDAQRQAFLEREGFEYAPALSRSDRYRGPMACHKHRP